MCSLVQFEHTGTLSHFFFGLPEVLYCLWIFPHFILKGVSLHAFSDHEELLVCCVGAAGPVPDGH